VAILRIDAQAMSADGFGFHKSEDGVVLVDEVPPKYIEVMEAEDDEVHIP
jgi:RNA:NAD 2'-phosphotransferase (TPT1/KptA family)